MARVLIVGPHTHMVKPEFSTRGKDYRRWLIDGSMYNHEGDWRGPHRDELYDAVPAPKPEAPAAPVLKPGAFLRVPAPKPEAPAAPVLKPGAFLRGLNSAQRKEVPLKRGLFDYFGDALAIVARHSYRSNEKHNPGQPLHWSHGKSDDHADCILRHVAGFGELDDGQPNEIGAAWRALAALQMDYYANPDKYK